MLKTSGLATHAPPRARLTRLGCASHRNNGRPKYQRLLSRSNLDCTCKSSTGDTSKEKLPDAIKGCQSLITELSGLNFSRKEIKQYFDQSVKLPKGQVLDIELKRVQSVVRQLIETGQVELADYNALQVAKAMLLDVWRWRRRGGGTGDEESSRAPHALALEALQGAEPKKQDIEQITSSLLDDLAMSNEDKREIGRAVESVAIAGIGSFVWGGIAFALLFLALFNFVLR